MMLLQAHPHKQHTHVRKHTHTRTHAQTHTSDTACIKFCALPVNISLASLSAASSKIK